MGSTDIPSIYIPIIEAILQPTDCKIRAVVNSWLSYALLCKNFFMDKNFTIFANSIFLNLKSTNNQISSDLLLIPICGAYRIS